MIYKGELPTQGAKSILRSSLYDPMSCLRHARLPCPSPTPRVCSNPCLLSRCPSTISSLVALFSSSLQSSPASRCFPMSQLFTSRGQSIGASASASVLPMTSFRIDCFDLFTVQGALKSLLQHHNLKASTNWCSVSLWSSFHICT